VDVGGPDLLDGERAPGSLLLVATRPLLGDQRGTVMVLSCVPNPQQVLVTVQWDGHTWQATATGPKALNFPYSSAGC
jgi:hypothetical protein